MGAAIVTRGPVFDGRARVRLTRMCTDIEQGVAAETQRRVQILGQSLFRYTKKAHDVPGKWRSHIHVVSRGGHRAVTDSGIIYGPWLEGTGSRNKTTRFKGYNMWRTTFANMNRSGAMEVARPIVMRTIPDLNA
jgi:hypothetical protein